MADHGGVIPKWNIIFLIYAKLGDAASETTYDPNLLRDTFKYLGDLKKEIKSIALSPNFNIWILENVVYLKNKQKVSDRSFLSILKHDPVNPSVNKFDIVKEYSEKNLVKSADLLKTVFQDIESCFAAEKNMIITWDHGSAFGIFKSTITDEASTPASSFDTFFSTISEQKIFSEGTSVSKFTFNIVQNKKFSKLEPEVAVTLAPDVAVEDGVLGKIEDILTNDELGTAIAGGFKNRKVDVLIMFNCYMQNMHTCYSLIDRVDFLVAPEGIISEPGYNYSIILKSIANYRDIDPQKLAAIAVTSMREKFICAGQSEKFEEHAMFAIDLTGYKTIIEKMRRLVKFLGDQMALNTIFKANLIMSRSPCYELDLPLNYSMIDFINWLTYLTSIIHTESLITLKEDFESAYNKLIIAGDSGNNVYVVTTRKSWERDSNVKPKGVTIYFPTTELLETDPVAENFIFPNAAFRTSLPDAIGWLDFLTKLYSAPV